MDQTILSDLCSTCHTEQPKYRCPRCRTQTCSLKCYKRHQQRASCSGKRDPASYVKKSKLATEAGIDQDYNYLKGVEHTIHDVGSDVYQRGVGVESRGSKVASRSWHRGSEFQRYLSEHQITVQQAPAGMSRHKSNNTRVTKNGNVAWTIEWADAENVRHVRDDCIGTKSVTELHAEFTAQQRNAEKKRSKPMTSQTQNARNKRKRPDTQKGDLQDAMVDKSAGDHVSSQQLEEAALASLQNPERESAGTAREALLQPNEPSKSASTIEKNPLSQEQHYYLLKPGTTNASYVLIPLDPSRSLNESLRGQFLQEYPTIFVFPHSPEDLPTKYILEASHSKIAKATGHAASHGEVNEFAASSNAAFDASHERHNQAATKHDHAVAELDASSILDMLKRDIAR